MKKGDLVMRLSGRQDNGYYGLLCGKFGYLGTVADNQGVTYDIKPLSEGSSRYSHGQVWCEVKHLLNLTNLGVDASHWYVRMLLSGETKEKKT